MSKQPLENSLFRLESYNNSDTVRQYLDTDFKRIIKILNRRNAGRDVREFWHCDITEDNKAVIGLIKSRRPRWLTFFFFSWKWQQHGRGAGRLFHQKVIMSSLSVTIYHGWKMTLTASQGKPIFTCCHTVQYTAHFLKQKVIKQQQTSQSIPSQTSSLCHAGVKVWSSISCQWLTLKTAAHSPQQAWYE